MEHVFISYSRKDEAFVDLLVEELRYNSHEVWWDRTEIRGGTEWAEEIIKGVDAAYAIIVIDSANSKKSEWVNKEIEMAKTGKKKRKVPIIPIRIDKSKISRAVDNRHAIDFSSMFEGSDIDTIRKYRDGVMKLLEALEEYRPMLRFLKQLKASNGEKREEAARILGNIGDPGAAEQLIKALRDMDPDVRYEAALSLGKLEIKNAFKPLIRLMTEDEEPDVSAAAATALGNLGMMEAIGSLELKLKHPDMFVRACVARALGKLGNVSAVNMLVELLRTDGISDVRAAAREALEKIGGGQAERALRRIRQYVAEENIIAEGKQPKVPPKQ